MNRRRVWVVQEKTGKKVSIPIAPELYSMLLKVQEWKINDKVLPKSSERYAIKAKDGTDTGVNLINKQILNVIKHVGLKPSVAVDGRKKKMTVYGAHSFRHGFASFCAEIGIPRAVCTSILGADAAIVDRYYVHIGEAAQEEAIMAMSKAGTNSNQALIDKALSIINGLKRKTEAIIKIENALKGN